MLKNENNASSNYLINEFDSDDDIKLEKNRFSSINSLSSLSNNFEDKNLKNKYSNDLSKNEDTDTAKARRIKKFNARKNRKLEQQKNLN